MYGECWDGVPPSRCFRDRGRRRGSDTALPTADDPMAEMLAKVRSIHGMTAVELIAPGGQVGGGTGQDYGPSACIIGGHV